MSLQYESYYDTLNAFGRKLRLLIPSRCLQTIPTPILGLFHVGFLLRSRGLITRTIMNRRNGARIRVRVVFEQRLGHQGRSWRPNALGIPQ
jgi:hypothetical protein